MVVEAVSLHSDAVAEDCAAREGAAGVDGEDCGGSVFGAEECDECVDEGAFACAGGACDADDVGASGAVVDGAGDGGGVSAAALHEREEACQGAPVAVQHGRGEGGYVV